MKTTTEATEFTEKNGRLLAQFSVEGMKQETLLRTLSSSKKGSALAR
jgi:hypothetical protein